MALRNTHPREDFLRYLDGDVDEEEKRELEKHLSECQACQDYVSFVGRFNEKLGQVSGEDFSSEEPCPDSWTLVSYEAGKVDEETARHLRAHLLFCDECAEEFYALRRLSREESWQALIERVKDFVVDLGKRYGPQALVGSIRIVAEEPVPARGGELARVLPKVLETSLGGNTYSIELAVTDEGSLSFDIAGFRIAQQAPLAISVRSETGGEILKTQSDEFGNGHFVLFADSIPDDLLLLTLKLGDKRKKILFRLPGRQESA